MPSEAFEAIVAGLRANPPFPAGLSAPEQRAHMESLVVDVVPEGITLDLIEIAGRPAERLVPEGGDSSRVVLYFHGGAYCIGSPALHRGVASRLATLLGIPAVVLDYRLAPEHPFPAALDDATAAFAALVASGIDPADIVVVGDSAGGGLAAATILALGASGGPLPAGCVCISPWVDLTFSAESWKTRADTDPTLTEESLRDAAGWYLAGHPPTDPLVSPIFGDFTGAPPMFVSAGDAEPLRDEAVMLAERARACGVDVECEITPEMIHVMAVYVGLVPEADAALEQIAGFVAGCLGSAASP